MGSLLVFLCPSSHSNILRLFMLRWLMAHPAESQIITTEPKQLRHHHTERLRCTSSAVTKLDHVAPTVEPALFQPPLLMQRRRLSDKAEVQLRVIHRV
ncbi:hypothetical protein K503DRAFT_627326 [Rhizopogon vinicolor AM-OR11-026]|uniref:Uncharacterized protein n=1 Tax=Rhizopogon vinicolor AM-OR11-026 TaxID=1314800 RepID=A0A1B7N648_9AGAM|nr:hypothetical protein K503DRAFT_627326 [Rhizopogon vinicolor AM-OR11-026]